MKADQASWRHAMEQMWHRIERRGSRGQLLDFVEVGACAVCGRGVDRACPNEYQIIAGRLHCRPCAPTNAPRCSPDDDSQISPAEADRAIRYLLGDDEADAR